MEYQLHDWSNEHTNMTEQTTLNAEQEAFLAYQAASSNSLEALKKTSAVFQEYMDASKATTNAYAEYVRLQGIETDAYAAYSAMSSIANGHTDDSNKLFGEWVKIRGY